MRNQPTFRRFGMEPFSGVGIAANLPMVLIVEDDVLIQSMVEEALKALHCAGPFSIFASIFGSSAIGGKALALRRAGSRKARVRRRSRNLDRNPVRIKCADTIVARSVTGIWCVVRNGSKLCENVVTEMALHVLATVKRAMSILGADG
jgi:hypothetical protein